MSTKRGPTGERNRNEYALLVYDAPNAWHDLAPDERQSLHGEYHALWSSDGVIAHYRLRPPKRTTTVRVEDDRVVTTEGPLADTREPFRALYLVETDDSNSAVDLAARIPAARRGGAVEVWPLVER